MKLKRFVSYLLGSSCCVVHCYVCVPGLYFTDRYAGDNTFTSGKLNRQPSCVQL